MAAELLFELFFVALAMFFISVFLSLGMYGHAGRIFPAAQKESEDIVYGHVSRRKCPVCGNDVLTRHTGCQENPGGAQAMEVPIEGCRVCGLSHQGPAGDNKTTGNLRAK